MTKLCFAEEEGQEETDNEPMTAQTPAPSSTAPTPAAPTPAEQHESDDNKIGEEDLDDDDDMATPVAPLGTPGSVLAVPVHDDTERSSAAAVGTGAGGDLPAEMMTKKQDTEQAIEQMMANRQGAESYAALTTHVVVHLAISVTTFDLVPPMSPLRVHLYRLN